MRRAAWLEGLLWGLAALLLAHGRGCVGALPSFEPGARAADTLRVLTWNVGGADDGMPHALEPEDLAHVARVLDESGAELVLLQETGDSEEELRERLGSRWTSVAGRGGTLALARRGSLARWSPPLARAVGVTWSVDGRTLAVLGVHASAFSARDRNRELGPLVEALLERRADGHLFAGDLNLDLDLDKRADLFSNDLALDVESYNFVAERLEDAARHAGPTAEPDRRLDYVFVSRAFTVHAAAPWRGRRVGTMDHEPLLVDLAFAPAH